MPPIAKFAPTTPPWAFNPPGNVGNVNPKGGLLLLPRLKIGGFAVPAKNVGLTSPCGLPRNSSCTLAEVSQLLSSPTPPRTTQAPLPVGSQAAPTRGPHRLSTYESSALCVAFAEP